MRGSIPSALSLVLALALALQGCQTVKNASPDPNVVVHYQVWTYENFSDKNGVVIHTAKTSAKAENSAKANFLFAYRPSNNCSNVLVSMGLEDYDKPFPNKFRSDQLQGEVRVDDEAPVTVPYDYAGEAGKTEVFVDFGKLFANQTIRAQVQKGQMISFKVEIEKKVRVLKFSLRNLTAVMNASNENCKDSASFTGSGSGPAKQAPAGQGKPADDDKKYFQ
ncbi:hypothetical protein [Fundidesulfovibrio terrae]|uniref:hypothetical protein n=1 Tax=Fundidesulfovibrio terrae TaxID=2922866 RepID=UPI001FAEC6D8|nr:hypothetical protein [Fundidesulfovibrio terrae]